MEDLPFSAEIQTGCQEGSVTFVALPRIVKSGTGNLSSKLQSGIDSAGRRT